MPRPASANDFQVAFKVPRSWIEKADRLAARASKVGVLGSTRTDILRTALQGGLEDLERSLVRAEGIVKNDKTAFPVAALRRKKKR